MPGSRVAQPEESQVFAGAGRHPPPEARAGATQFSAERPVGLSCQQQEDGIGSVIGVQLSGLNQRLQQVAGKTTALLEIVADAVQLAVVGDGQAQGAAAFRNGGRVGRSRRGARPDDESAGPQMLFQPGHRRADIDLGQVHHQIDRSAAAVVRMPGSELGTGDRQGASLGVPFGSVVWVADRAPERQHGRQGDLADRLGTSPELVEVPHPSAPGCWFSGGLRLRPFLSLNT